MCCSKREVDLVLSTLTQLMMFELFREICIPRTAKCLWTPKYYINALNCQLARNMQIKLGQSNFIQVCGNFGSDTVWSCWVVLHCEDRCSCGPSNLCVSERRLYNRKKISPCKAIKLYHRLTSSKMIVQFNCYTKGKSCWFSRGWFTQHVEAP